MALGKCLKCDKIDQMTEDHVLPQWFVKQLPNFGLKPPTGNNVQLVCAKCNNDKGSKFDFSDLSTRHYLKQIVVGWVSEIRKHEEFPI